MLARSNYFLSFRRWRRGESTRQSIYWSESRKSTEPLSGTSPGVSIREAISPVTTPPFESTASPSARMKTGLFREEV